MADMEYKNGALCVNKFDVNGNSIETINDTEDRTEILLDSSSKIISYRKIDGVLVENCGIVTPKGEIKELDVDVLNLSDKAKSELLGDASNPHLRLDRIDIISDILTVNGNNISPLSWTKNEVGSTETNDVLFKYTSKNGSFVDNCVIAYQGNSSISWAKKGFAVDLQNKHRFKDWIAHDSFNIKGYATDWMHVREYIGTTIYEQMMQHRPLGHRRPWEVYNDFKEKDYQVCNPSSALGHSDQHPVELYINGNYWGLYSISLKKKRENYEMKKNNAKHIMLDSEGFSVAGSSFNWKGAEIRFPKEDGNKKKILAVYTPTIVQEPPVERDGHNVGDTVAVLKEGNIYTVYLLVHYAPIWEEIGDFDLSKGSILYKYNGDCPMEIVGEDNVDLYDSSNATHVFCNTVKKNINNFYHFMHDIDSSTTKEQIEAHWNVEEFIDSYLHCNFICNGDVGGKNTLYCAWDGVHFAPISYDFDLVFGTGYSHNGMLQTDVHLAFERYPASNREGSFDCIPGAAQIKALYRTEIEARYKELRDCGIFTSDNVSNIIRDWMIEVGEDVYKDDLDRWDGMYGNRGTHVLDGTEGTKFYISQQKIVDYVIVRLQTLDEYFHYTT